MISLRKSSGQERQRQLLAAEEIATDPNGSLDLAKYRWPSESLVNFD